MKNSRSLDEIVEALRPEMEALSDRVWEVPETCYAETRSAAEHSAELLRQGFRVTEAIAGIPTAMMGEAGEGGPVIAFLGEFDALPGLSQTAGLAEWVPLQPGGNGHGCGHNLLGAGSMLAAVALARWLAEQGLPGRVRYYGCPAEEGGGAKAFMVRAGAFDDVDIAFSWHPDCFCEVQPAFSLANLRVDFTFTGTAAHAASSPHLGRSALDSVELMNVGCNYLREHVPTDCRFHYAMIDGGGIAPNVVQSKATVRYSIRSPELPMLRPLYERICDVARGAALMCGTKLEIKVLSAVSNLLPNLTLDGALWDALEAAGPPPFDEDDRALARAIRATLTQQDIEEAFALIGAEPDPDLALADAVVPRDAPRKKNYVSTDVGDVSWVVPLAQMQAATCAVGTPFHSWQLVAQGKSPLAKKGMVLAARVMAAAGARVLTDPSLLEAARGEFARRTARTPYECPLPEGTDPPIAAMAGSA